jgi:hypothetical protein
MTLWYRYAQSPPASPFTSLKTKEATPEEIDLAKKLIELKSGLQNSSLSKMNDDQIKKIIEANKEIFVILKKVSSTINDLANNIPFENLKPTLNQISNSINNLSEQNVSISLAKNIAPEEIKKKINDLEKFPTNLDAAISVVKKMDAKDVYYYTNLIGDLAINAKPMNAITDFPAAALLIPVKIMDYKLTWIPDLENDINKLKTAKNKKEYYNSLSRIIGFAANLCMDIGFTIRPLSFFHPTFAAVSLSLTAIGATLQAASLLIQPDSPLNYKEINKLPGKLTDSLGKIYEGVPLIESAKDVNFKNLGDVQKNALIGSLIMGLATEYRSYDPQTWTNAYGTKKYDLLIHQPSFVVMKFAKDLFSERYPWLNQPDDANYRNLARAFNTAVKDFKKIKLPKPKAPSKRSIGYQLVDSALNNQMTNQFSAPLIREMANKYTAGNIYNFLNKKNVEIIDLLSKEQSNQNFAERFNVRPGSAGVDSIKLDIANLKKILNTWK